MDALLRMQEHQNGIKCLRQGDVVQALSIFKTAVSNYGPHVGLLSDIIACYSLLGDLLNLNDSVVTLQGQLKLAQKKLQTDSLARTHLFLAKIYEDQAHLSSALSELSQARALTTASLPIRISIQVNQLRLLTFLRQKQNLSEPYYQCLSYAAADANLHTEIEHSLILCEMELFGPQFSLQRLKLFLQDQTVTNVDKNLVLVDYLELLVSDYLLKCQNLNSETKDTVKDNGEDKDHLELKKLYVNQLSPLLLHLQQIDLFEKAIVEFAQAVFAGDSSIAICAVDVGWDQILFTMKNISKMNALRFLGIYNLCGGPHQKELQKQFDYLLTSIDVKSADLLRQRYSLKDHCTAVASMEFAELDLVGCKLILGKQEVSYKKESIVESILIALIDLDNIQTDRFYQSIYKEEMSYDSLPKLRMAIKRLNLEIKQHTGISQFIEMNKLVVKTKLRIQLMTQLERLSS
jgi:hypothetical protein